MLEKTSNYYQLPQLGQLNYLKHGFSTKHFGNMSLSWGQEGEVLSNRRRFVNELGLVDRKFVTFWLTHSSKVAVIEDAMAGQSITDRTINLTGFDGVITNRRGLFFLLCSADCLPLIFLDTRKRVLGVAHAGWKGLVGEIHLKVVRLMEERFGTQVSDLRVSLGPGILSCCNLQKPPVVQNKLPGWNAYLHPEKDGLYRIFLVEYCVDSLIRLGVRPENIERSDFCTVDNCGELFSETAVQSGLDKDPMGRFATVVGLL